MVNDSIGGVCSVISPIVRSSGRYDIHVHVIVSGESLHVSS